MSATWSCEVCGKSVIGSYCTDHHAAEHVDARVDALLAVLELANKILKETKAGVNNVMTWAALQKAVDKAHESL